MNILFVLADQLTARTLPAYGNEVVSAPHVQRLADEGVVFDSAYCNSPLCAPSRASLLTGQLPSRIGAYDNAAEFAAAVPTIAHHLRSRGYATCLAGKMHFIGPDQLHGFEERLTTDVYTAGMDWVPDWTLPLEKRLPWYHDMSSVLGAGVAEATLQLDYDEEVAFTSVRKLYDLARADDGRPFFFTVSFTHPHDPYEIPSAYWNRYEGVEIDPPVVPLLPEDEVDPLSRRVRTMCSTDEVEITDELVRNARRAYYAAVSYVDDKLGELLDALERTGLADDTVVVLGSDHGDMLGERGLWYKMTFFEDSARVPLVVHAPGRFRPGRVGEHVSLVDLLPTFVELAGDGPPEGGEPLDGASLVPLLEGEAAGRDDTVAAEYLAEGTYAPCVMLRHGAHKFIHCPGDPDQLYDLERDPRELTNLAEDPACAELVDSFLDDVHGRWDLDELDGEIRASQQRRLVAAAALAIGAQQPWDYAPPDDSPRRYVRGRNFWEPFGRARLRRPPAS